jgi:hypothetical protein
MEQDVVRQTTFRGSTQKIERGSFKTENVTVYEIRLFLGRTVVGLSNGVALKSGDRPGADQHQWVVVAVIAEGDYRSKVYRSDIVTGEWCKGTGLESICDSRTNVNDGENS